MVNTKLLAVVTPPSIYQTPWITFKGCQSRILQPWIQNIYDSTLPNSFYTILHVMDMTVYPCIIVYFRCTKSVENVSFGYLSTSYINMVLAIGTTIFMVRYDTIFWCEDPSTINLISWCLFNSSAINSEVLKIPLSVWYPLITTTWIWSSFFNKKLYRLWMTYIEI